MYNDIPGPSSRCKFKTYQCVDQIGKGVNERPDPLAVGLWVNGTGRRADGQTPGALLGVHLHEVKGPKQMLWVATLWEEGVPLEQLPCFFDNEHAHPKKLMEVPRLRRCRFDTVRRPVLDVPGQCLEVRHLPGSSLLMSLLDTLLADIIFGGGGGGGGGQGGGREGGNVCCFVVCCYCGAPRLLYLLGVMSFLLEGAPLAW